MEGRESVREVSVPCLQEAREASHEQSGGDASTVGGVDREEVTKGDHRLGRKTTAYLVAGYPSGLEGQMAYVMIWFSRSGECRRHR